MQQNIAVLMSDLVTLANSNQISRKKGASKEELQKILNGKTKGVFLLHWQAGNI